MHKKGSKVPFLDIDPSPTKRSRSESRLKSKIQRAPEAEDGEIVSSPEYDAADIEINIHAEMTTSEEDSDVEHQNDISEKKKQPKSEVKHEVIQVYDTPPEKEKKEFANKEHRKKLVIPPAHHDHDVEIDHLEISAPSQSGAKKSKNKSAKDNLKSSLNNKKLESPDKDRRKHKSKSLIEDHSRKRPYDVFDERKGRSDAEYEDRHHRSEKKIDHAEDLRKHLLKKMNDSKDKNSEYNEKRHGTSEKNRVDVERHRDNQSRSKESYDSFSSRDKEKIDSRDKHSTKSRSSNRSKDDSKNNLSSYSDKHKDAYSSDSRKDSRRKEKSKSRKTDEKNGKVKKMKKRKHRDSENDAYAPSKKEDKYGKSPEVLPEVEKKRELTYDDISSDESVESLAQSPYSSDHSDNQRSLSPSVSGTGSLSSSPERSPTPIKKRSYYPGIEGCRDVNEFIWLNRIEEGTYGVVYRAKDRRTDEIVALKRLKMEKEREGFPITSLREINTLLKAQHPNIVTVREIVVGSNVDKIYIVMDYVEHDLKSLMETMTQPFLVGEVKTLMIQLFRGVHHMHDNWILHRDIKASNLLLSHKGILKIGDFGLAREYGSPLKRYTSIVVTLWYRAPELLLGQKEYSTPIDLWSCGCVMAELLTMKPLFPGKSEIDQINKVFKELGTPSDKIWPGPPAYSELPQIKKMNIVDHPYSILRNRFGATLTDTGYDLLTRQLTYDPQQRITAEEALKHPYFTESPKPVEPSMFPTWPAKSELGHRNVKKKNASPKPPEGGEFGKQVGEDVQGGFHMISTTKGSSAKSSGFNLKF